MSQAPVTPSPVSADDRAVHNIPGPSYQSLLDQDRYPVPDILRRRAEWDDALAYELSRRRYFDQRTHDAEVAQLWSRVWQVVCREEHLRNVGDSVLYEIADRQFVVVRSDDGTIKAFPNTCLHRGRQLREGDGSIRRLRCPYHGFTWNLDGTLNHIPAAWDFCHVSCERLRLPEAAVDTWAGFVFINPDVRCEPLRSFLGELPEHLERYGLENWYTHVDAAMVVECNWKLIMEAFIEAHHVYATHPQALAGTDPCNTQHDLYDNFVRFITPVGVPSGLLRGEPSEQRKMDATMGRASAGARVITLPEGVTARHYFADIQRKRLRKAGLTTEFCDSELVDLHTYGLFPNFLAVAGGRGMIMRARPYRDDPGRSIMDVSILRPIPAGQEPPPPAEKIWLQSSDSFNDHPLLADFGLLDQDLSNLATTHQGLKNLPDMPLVLGLYQEAPIAWFHKQLYGRWVSA